MPSVIVVSIGARMSIGHAPSGFDSITTAENVA
jgi:hypothetical protein